jgi:hypothetical protein
MCNYRTLVYNKNGYIIQCNSCDHLQLAFGTTVTSLYIELFHTTADHITKECLYRNPCCEPELKRTSIPIDTHTMLCLNFTELEAINEIFIQAKALLEMYTILESH